MATSGSVDFSLNTTEVIQSALEVLGIAISGEAIDANDISVARRALNVQIKAWQAYGVNLWTRDDLSLTLVASQASYTIGRSGTPDLTADRPLRIIESSRVDSDGNETPLDGLSLSEYENLSSKTTTGTPVSYYFEPTLDNSTIKFWPVPDTTAASDYTVSLISQSPLEDMDGVTDDFDFPSEWYEALIYGLALRLAPRFGGISTTELSLIKNMADEALELVLSWDVENVSLQIQPDIR